MYCAILILLAYIWGKFYCKTFLCNIKKMILEDNSHNWRSTTFLFFDECTLTRSTTTLPTTHSSYNPLGLQPTKPGFCFLVGGGLGRMFMNLWGRDPRMIYARARPLLDLQVFFSLYFRKKWVNFTWIFLGECIKWRIGVFFKECIKWRKILE